MKLYSYHRNSAGERVRIALALKGLDYEYVSAPALGDAYLTVNPQGLMPSLDTGGRIITQSAAILDWLEQTHPTPPLLSSDPVLRAQALAFSQVITAEMHAITVMRVRRKLGDLGVATAGIDDWCRHWMAEGLGTLHALLARRETVSAFCYGSAPGWADLHLVPQMSNARRLGCDVTAFPLLCEVEARCVALDAFQRARPERQPDYIAPQARS